MAQPDQSNSALVSRWRGFRFAACLIAALCAHLSSSSAWAAPGAGPLQSGPSGHYLAELDGSPFFWLGDTAWALFERLTREEADAYLKDRADKGFNVVQAVAIGGPFDSLDVPNRYGELALIEMDPLRPNPRYFEHIDWVIARAHSYGLRVALLPVWGSSLVGGLQLKEELFTPETARAYGEWIGRRYSRQGLIWVLGGDTNPLWPIGLNFLADPDAAKDTSYPVLKDFRPIYDAMAEGIIAAEGDTPLITYHPSPIIYSGANEPRTSLYFGDRPWFGLNMIQSSHFLHPAIEIFPALRSSGSWDGTRNYEPIRAEFETLPVRPVLDGEPRYEGLPIDIKWDPAKGSWGAYDARNAAYHAVFAGAAGHTFGNASVHLSWDPAVREKDAQVGENYPQMGGPWHVQLDSEGAGQMRFLKQLMLSRPYFSRVPDQSLVVGDAGEGVLHVGATRDAHWRYAMVFIPDGRTVTLDLSGFAGKQLGSVWYDPRSGQVTADESGFSGGGQREFRAPTSGAGSDWVLVIDELAAGFPPPGTRAR